MNYDKNKNEFKLEYFDDDNFKKLSSSTIANNNNIRIEESNPDN